MQDLTLEELKEAIKAHMDEASLLEALDLTTEELVEILEDQITEKYEDLLKIVG